ncbi:UDP-N-acetylmuramate dehydrogenase [Nannocystis radixulma]|uniref:UDP-N-acetylenolpyruvoylglucosamine reductase n=1 Tax=Nannocystis radixulma TaxID=2995305 RepID=A0ABT5B5C3_9BACT|nr:UDP-N-acetylmuramate dehydrogenase [Nannocystis radixulma]MDC0668256.1 UDP-N-acetylmuramate dehydrogenase [Nannocystis radixulma]
MSGTRGQRLLGELGDLDLPEGALELRLDEPMARHTTLRLGGPADLWARPTDARALQALLTACHARGVPVTFVGGGSNLLVRDGGIRGVVINLARMNRVERPDPADPVRVDVEAGATTGRLLQHVTAWELGGLEFLGGVPGSVGGGLIMNAGTYLGEFTKVVTRVRSLHRDGSARVRDHAACGFRYRGSDLPPDEIVVGAELRCWPRPRAEIEADVAGLRERRRQREPTGVANNGSTFKNPPGEFAGRIIEAAGLKGTRIGACVVSPVHANWLVVERPGPDVPEARAADLLALIDLVRERVRQASGVELELEVKIAGEAV